MRVGGRVGGTCTYRLPSCGQQPLGIVSPCFQCDLGVLRSQASVIGSLGVLGASPSSFWL